ncbi:MAG: hypothetical protein AAB391_01015 [Patescibacteria group bacterium]
MTLSTHAVVGAAVAAALPNHPILGGLFAFGSHFLLDALPHWDYKILSASANPDVPTKLTFDRLFMLDLVRIGGDALLGLVVAGVFFWHPIGNYFWLIGALAAILPDFLQFVYSKYPKGPIAQLQAFHRWIHTSHRLEGKTLLGIASQLALVVLVLLVSSR